MWNFMCHTRSRRRCPLCPRCPGENFAIERKLIFMVRYAVATPTTCHKIPTTITTRTEQQQQQTVTPLCTLRCCNRVRTRRIGLLSVLYAIFVNPNL